MFEIIATTPFTTTHFINFLKTAQSADTKCSSIEVMLKFIGLTLLMGIVRKPLIAMYWSDDPILHTCTRCFLQSWREIDISCLSDFGISITMTSRPASVAQLAETQCALTGTVCQRSRGSIPGSAGRFCVRISGAHALRLISRAGKEGSTVSSIICDRWLILS